MRSRIMKNFSIYYREMRYEDFWIVSGASRPFRHPSFGTISSENFRFFTVVSKTRPSDQHRGKISMKLSPFFTVMHALPVDVGKGVARGKEEGHMGSMGSTESTGGTPAIPSQPTPTPPTAKSRPRAWCARPRKSPRRRRRCAGRTSDSRP